MPLRLNLDLAARATKMLQWGLSPGLAFKELGPGDPDTRDAVRLAELRLRAQEKFRRAAEMVFDEVGLETATPEAVARYRAARLAAPRAVDLTCGVGGDALALAAVCSAVVAIDEDEDRLAMAEHNCRVHGLDNVTFVQGDALVHASKVAAATKEAAAATGAKAAAATGPTDVVFADPLRRKDERRVSSLDETLPSTSRLLRKLASHRFAVEVSSRLSPGDLTFEARAEREWIGLGPETNCATLYFGDLARCDTSAVVLPLGSFDGKGAARLERPFDAAPKPAPAPRPADDHIFEVHDAVLRAGMEGELAAAVGGEVGLWGESFFTAREARASPFFLARYEVLDRAPLHDADLVKALKSWNAGKALLRWPMPPTDHVRKTRALQQRLTGSDTITVFNESGRALLCRFA